MPNLGSSSVDSWLKFRGYKVTADAQGVFQLGQAAQGGEARDIEIQLRIGHGAARVDELRLIDLAQVALAGGDAKSAVGGFDALGGGIQRCGGELQILQR